MEVLIAKPRGFCAGVDRAIETVDLAIKKYPQKKIFVLHEIVHNKRVLKDFRAKGVSFIEDPSFATEDSVLIFSAHGVSEAIENCARSKNITVINATCPLVTKVHKEAILHQKNNKELIIIGNKDHPEIIGTIGRLGAVKTHIVQKIEDIEGLDVNLQKNLAYVTQTTLSAEKTKAIIKALKDRFTNIVGNSDICYATQNRQDAVKDLAKVVELMIIIGSFNSSNSKNLYYVANQYCGKSYMIDCHLDLNLDWFFGIKKVGISSGASAPEVLVQEVVEFLKQNFDSVKISDFLVKAEKVKFKLPKI